MLKKRTLALLLSLTMLLSLLTPTALATEGEESGTTREEVVKPNEDEQTDLNGATENGDAKDENQDPQQPTTGDEEQPTGQDEPKNEDETKGEDGQPGEEPKQPGDEQPTDPEQGEETETPEEPQESEFDAAAAYLYFSSLDEEAAEEYINSLSDDEFDALIAYMVEIGVVTVDVPSGDELVGFPDVDAAPLFDFSGYYTGKTPAKAPMRAPAVNAAENEEIETTKTVTRVNSDNDENPIYRIDLNASTDATITVTTANAVDIILVLDTSKEMRTKVEIDDWSTTYTAKKLKSLYDKARDSELYFKVGEEYYRVTGNKQGNSYTFSYTDANGNVCGIQNATEYTYYVKNTNFTYDQGEARLTALQAAARTFITNAAESDNRRIALVSYNDTASVLTGPTKKAVDGALLPAQTNEQALYDAINSLTVEIGADANCNYGMAAAKSIFQDGNTTVPENRPRVVILLSAGVFGSEGTLYSEEDCTVAIDTIWLSSILKMPRTKTTYAPEQINDYIYGIDFNSRFYGQYYDGNTNLNKDSGTSTVKQEQVRARFENKYRAEGAATFDYTGCGATVYCVGLGMPKNSSTVTWSNGKIQSNGLVYGGLGERINEAMYRICSHRPDGSHVSDTDSNGKQLFYNSWEDAFAADTSWSGHYLDELTRNREEGSYFLTTDKTEDLQDIFSKITQSIGKDFGELTVRDYLTPYFEVCDENGNALKVGDKTADGGTVCVDASGNLYVEWSGQLGKDHPLSESFYIKPKADFWGGNGVPTNLNTSAIYNGDKVEKSFPVPDGVDVPLKDPTVTGGEYHIYYNGDLPTNNGFTTNVPDHTDPNDWRTVFVNLTVEYGKLSNTEDSTVKATFTVTPKSEGTYKSKTADAEVKGYVYVPTFTVTARDIWADYNQNVDLRQWGVAGVAGPIWKHGNDPAESEKMYGKAPAVADQAITICAAGTKTPALTNYTTGVDDADFDITGMTCTVGGKSYNVPETGLTVNKAVSTEGHDFIIHINHFTLTIEKTGCKSPYDQDFIFQVKNGTDNEAYQLVIHGNGSKEVVGLVCGKTYTVEEEKEWSWRYLPDANSYDVTCTKHEPIANKAPSDLTTKVTAKNTLNVLKWLDGISHKDNK